MPETRFNEIPALSVDPRFDISQYASETNVWLFFLPMILKIINYHSSCFIIIIDILRRIRTFSKRHSACFHSGGCECYATSLHFDYISHLFFFSEMYRWWDAW